MQEFAPQQIHIHANRGRRPVRGGYPAHLGPVIPSPGHPPPSGRCAGPETGFGVLDAECCMAFEENKNCGPTTTHRGIRGKHSMLFKSHCFVDGITTTRRSLPFVLPHLQAQSLKQSRVNLRHQPVIFLPLTSRTACLLLYPPTQL